MSQPVYEVAPQARQAVYAAYRKALGMMKYGTLDSGIWRRVTGDEARAWYRAEIIKIMRDAHIEVNPNSPIAIQCSNCKKVEMVARDVKVFRCPCSSYEEQWVVKSRYFDFSDSTRVINSNF